MRTAFPRWFLLIPALFAGLLSSMPAPSQTEITIGAGTGSMPYPPATSYQDARTQVIYLAGEIGSAYKITALSLDITTLPGQTLNNFTIRMKHTSLSAYPSPASWESSGWTTVYQANEMITSTGWKKFTFSTPFQYNGVDNLMVDFSFDNASSSTDGKCRYTAPGAIRTIYYRANGGYGDPLTWSDSTPSSTRVNAIPNVKLEIGSVAMPTFSPDGGVFESSQNVTVSCATPGATIHYTTNGLDPTESDPVIASGSTVTVDHTLTLKAKAWKAGIDPSLVKSATYTLVVVTPTFNPDGGVFESPGNVTVMCATPGATIHYTTNGVDPTESDAAVASGSTVLVDHRLTLKAKAYKASLTPSGVKSASYIIPGVLYVRPDASDANDGSSWVTAKRTVQAALSAAVAGDKIWVKAAIYSERISLASGVPLYGGFNGTEAVLAQRNWTANRTILDGGGAGTVVTSPAGATATTVIDGFTIRNGRASYGGGIYCYNYSSPTITNNTITGNTASYGGGIRCYSSSPAITNNTITGNSASYGGGINCTSSSPAISNNTITGNSAWDGGGIYNYSGSPAVSNNIVAFNASGVYKDSGSGAPVLKNNCVYGNASYDYSGLPAGTGDISADPTLADRAYGNVHIQPSSPCINAGWNDAPGLPSTDMDGQPRIHGGIVDIGADESDGTTWPSGPYVIVRVTPTGSDANDGSGWDDAHAKLTVQAGIDAASALGGEVWVRAGTYSERIALRRYAYVYGGFGGSETSRAERNWRTNVTILDGGAGESVVTAAALGYQLGAIDGFTIRNGRASYGGGIYCDSSSPAITNNTITGNSAYAGGGGICCYSSSPAITNNTISGNTASSGGGGIYCYYSSATVINNTITGNTAASYGGGIRCALSSPAITNNIVAFNSSGIFDIAGSPDLPVLRNNCVYGNTSYDYSGVSAGTGDISADPLFVDKDNADYHLQTGSPCTDTGTNTGAPTTDIEGCIRPQDGDGDGSAICDIGAYEFPLSLSLAKKNYVGGTSLAFGCASVTAKFPSLGCVYVGNLDRSSGIRVDTSETLSETALVNVHGTIQTDTTTGERYVQALSGWPKASGGQKSLRALAMIGRNVGGGTLGLQQGVRDEPVEPRYSQGLNNIGLLVTVFGNVTFAGADYFYLDDGSKLNDDSGHIGVKVSPQGLSFPSSGYVRVTGISSCEKKGSDLVRLIRAVSIVPAP